MLNVFRRLVAVLLGIEVQLAGDLDKTDEQGVDETNLLSLVEDRQGGR